MDDVIDILVIVFCNDNITSSVGVVLVLIFIEFAWVGWGGCFNNNFDFACFFSSISKFDL